MFGRCRYYSIKVTRLTMFTKENCMLCFNACKILNTAVEQTETPVNLTFVDIMKKENIDWYDKYESDVPVLHVDRDGKQTVFMHYFFKNKIIDAIEGRENNDPEEKPPFSW